ncbi:MAG: LysR family transcriptional regulator [Rhodobacteraceae bacterium]|nr:LysR family transcriptional regulator [Paracoccaceae bacterium]
MVRRSPIKQRHIDCFLTIVRTGSIHAAAQQLNLSQPALSRTLADLEEKLGTKVMDRSRTGVSLTQAGEVFLRYASAAAAAIEQGFEQVALVRRDERPVVAVGALPNVQVKVMPRAVESFMHRNPGVLVRVLDGTNKQLMQLLRLGEVDFVVGRLASPDDMLGLTFEPLYSEEIMAVVRPGHPALAIDEPAALAAAMTAAIQILPNRGTIIREGAEQLLLSAGARLSETVIESLSTPYCRATVQVSDAIWVSPRGVVDGDIRDGVLAQLPLDSAATRGWVGVTTRRGYPLSRHAQGLLGVVRQETGTIV